MIPYTIFFLWKTIDHPSHIHASLLLWRGKLIEVGFIMYIYTIRVKKKNRLERNFLAPPVLYVFVYVCMLYVYFAHTNIIFMFYKIIFFILCMAALRVFVRDVNFYVCINYKIENPPFILFFNFFSSHSRYKKNVTRTKNLVFP